MHWPCRLLLGHFLRFISLPSPTSNLCIIKHQVKSPSKTFVFYHLLYYNYNPGETDISEQELTNRKMVECFDFQTKCHNTGADYVHSGDVGRSIQENKKELTVNIDRTTS